MKNARTQTAILVALGAALAMPLALAQSAEPPPQAQEAAAEQAAQDVQDAQEAATTGAQAEERQLGWNDVDADGNGSISREESAALPALAATFDEADADGDGELTAEEYRAHAAKAGGGN